MTVPTISYITAAEVIAQTQLADLKVLDTADITILIQTAEDMIDAYVGPQPHHPYDSNLNRVFPREQDITRTGSSTGITVDPETPAIPYKVSRATLRQVEWLYSQWWDNSDSAELPTSHAVESLQIGGDGSYSETRANKGLDFSSATICPQAKVLLNGFRSRTAALDVTDPDHVIAHT